MYIFDGNKNLALYFSSNARQIFVSSLNLTNIDCVQKALLKVNYIKAMITVSVISSRMSNYGYKSDMRIIAVIVNKFWFLLLRYANVTVQLLLNIKLRKFLL